MSVTDSFFANKEYIESWIQELSRTAVPNDESVEPLMAALVLLKHLEPNETNAKTAYSLIDKAALKDNMLAVALKGIAMYQAFGCTQDISTSLILMRMAAERENAEAKNFLGLLCIAKTNLMMAMRMFRDAAYGGHPRALRNYLKIAKQVRKDILKARHQLDAHQRKVRHKKRHRRNHEYLELDAIERQQHAKKKSNELMLLY